MNPVASFESVFLRLLHFLLWWKWVSCIRTQKKKKNLNIRPFGMTFSLLSMKHQIAIISMPPRQPTPPPFSKSHHCQYPSTVAIIFPFSVSNDARALLSLCVAVIHKMKKERKKNPRSHKKSIFRTTLDYVIRLDYASIDVACKHRIIHKNDEDPAMLLAFMPYNKLRWYILIVDF